MAVTGATRGVTVGATPGWRRDLRWLWGAYSVSALGSAFGLGALPLIAVVVLDVSTLRVSLLTALAGVAGVVVALPLGPWVEFRRKRPVMVGADLARCAALLSVPAAVAGGVLTYPQLCLVAVVQAVGTVVHVAASGAHLKALVPAGHRTRVNSRFETTLWTTFSVGPPVGGLLVAWLGAAATVTVDAVTFLLSALGVRRLRTPEPPPPPPVTGRSWTARVTEGWRHLHEHPVLAALFWNSLVFGGGVMAMSPLLTVLMLRDLGFAPWAYGLALGLPAVGGVLGSLLATPLVDRYGQRAVLLAGGVGRAAWWVLLPLARPGPGGLALIVAAQTLALAASGVFNPVFVTYRMAAVGDGHLARVVTTWSVANRIAQPVCVAAAGLLAALTGPRTAIAVAAVVVLASAVCLPWRRPPG